MEVTASWDTFMSLVATTRKLGLSFFEDVHDRISQTIEYSCCGNYYLCSRRVALAVSLPLDKTSNS